MKSEEVLDLNHLEAINEEFEIVEDDEFFTPYRNFPRRSIIAHTIEEHHFMNEVIKENMQFLTEQNEMAEEVQHQSIYIFDHVKKRPEALIHHHLKHSNSIN
jgi:hypothetical protein